MLLWQLLVAGAWANTGLQTGLDIRLVGTVPALQRAINDGVKHVVLTEHISAISAQQEIEGSGESLDSAIGSIQSDTKSITVRLIRLLCEPFLIRSESVLLNFCSRLLGHGCGKPIGHGDRKPPQLGPQVRLDLCTNGVAIAQKRSAPRDSSIRCMRFYKLIMPCE